MLTEIDGVGYNINIDRQCIFIFWAVLKIFELIYGPLTFLLILIMLSDFVVFIPEDACVEKKLSLATQTRKFLLRCQCSLHGSRSKKVNSQNIL